MIDIVAGPLHSAALTNKNRLFVTGFGEKYALGTGKKSTVNDFTEVNTKCTAKIEKMEAGIKTLAFISIGKVYLAGTLGNKVFDTLTYIAFPEEVIQVKLIESTAYFLSKSGHVYQFG